MIDRSPNFLFSVISTKAEIRFFQPIPDFRLHGSDGISEFLFNHL
jgi:hypothetical protein